MHFEAGSATPEPGSRQDVEAGSRADAPVRPRARLLKTTSPPSPTVLACTASTCSPGGTSTILRPAARSSTPSTIARLWAAGRPRRHDADLGRRRATRPAPSATATGWSARPGGTGCSPGAASERSGGGGRSGDGAGRDLERHALLLSRSGPAAPASCSSTTSTPRCGSMVLQPGLARARRAARVPLGAAVSTAAAASSPSPRRRKREIVEHARAPPDAGLGRPPGRRPPVHPGRRPFPRPAGGRRRTPGAGQALRRCSSTRWSSCEDAIPASRR